MKIEFDPRDEEQRQEALIMLRADKAFSALEAIYLEARKVLKYGNTDDAKILIEALEDIKQIAAQYAIEDEI